MRTKRVFINSVAALTLRLVSVVCGFILPKLMLRSFGSEVNGAVSSISQFLEYITLIEAGAGGVTRAVLYKPLAMGDITKINAIINASQIFFRKIAYIFVGYVIFLSCTFKYISKTELDWGFTFLLVWILAISIFIQYYFGTTYIILIKSDQQEYISSCLQTGCVLLSTFMSIALLKNGYGIYVIKIAGTAVYVLKLILLNIIVRRKYKIDGKIAPDYNAMKQRWNGFGQHIAYYIHNNVDMMIITIMMGLKWASVYSIYRMITNGVKQVVLSVIGANEAAFGNMIAKNEKKVLENRFHVVETLASMIIVIFFSTTGLIIFDFIKIYTDGIKDINYLILPVGILFVISEAVHCIKQIYHNLILAAGHYKETQKGAFIEAGLNLSLSVIFAKYMGMPGIILATIISTIYRIIDYIIHLSKEIINRKINVFLQRQCINIFNSLLIVFICLSIPFSDPMNYKEWVLKAIPIFLISCSITFFVNLVFYHRDLFNIGIKMKEVFKK